MDAAAKTCNSLQNFLVLMSGVLFTFLLSADDAAQYERALNDVRALGEAEELSNFITTKWIIERRSTSEVLPIYQESNRALKRFAVALEGSMNELDVSIDEEQVFEDTIFTNGRQARLAGWERPDLFLSLPPAGATVWRLLAYLERERLEGTALVLPSYDFWLYPHITRKVQQDRVELKGMRLVGVQLVSENLGKGKIDRFELRPRNEIPCGRFRFSFDRQSDVPLVELDVDAPMNRTAFYMDEDEWVALQHSWYASRNIDAYMYVPAASNYSNLRMVPEIGNMAPRDAMAWLRDKLSGGERSVSFFGISVAQNLVSIAGPVMLSIFMIGLISVMQHITALAKMGVRVERHSVYWGVISPSRTARVIGLVSVSLIPGLVCAVLPFYMGGGAAAYSLSALGIVAAFVVFLNARKLAIESTGEDPPQTDKAIDAA